MFINGSLISDSLYLVGIHGNEIVFDENKEVQYPFRLYRFGKERK